MESQPQNLKFRNHTPTMLVYIYLCADPEGRTRGSNPPPGKSQSNRIP